MVSSSVLVTYDGSWWYMVMFGGVWGCMVVLGGVCAAGIIASTVEVVLV